MQKFRTASLRIFVILVAGAAFVNLTLLQLEIDLIRLTDPAIAENIAYILSTVTSEEERECSESDNESKSVSEIDFLLHHSALHHASQYIIAQANHRIANEALFHRGYLKKFSPPPEA